MSISPTETLNFRQTDNKYIGCYKRFKFSEAYRVSMMYEHQVEALLGIVNIICALSKVYMEAVIEGSGFFGVIGLSGFARGYIYVAN